METEMETAASCPVCTYAECNPLPLLVGEEIATRVYHSSIRGDAVDACIPAV